MIELRHLRYFIAVAEELSFRRAAERIHIDQTPLSRTIRDLEDQLGVLLFVRSPRKLSLTPAGACLLQESRKVFVRIKRAQQATRETDARYRAPLHIGIADGIAQPKLAECFKRWREVAPEIPLELREMRATELADTLKREEVDVGFAFGLPDDALITQDAAWSYPVMALLPKDHELASSSVLSASELLSFPLLSCSEDRLPGLLHQMRAIASHYALRPTLAGEANTLSGYVTRIAIGMGVGLVDAGHVAILHRTDVVAVPLVESEFVTTYVLHKHRRFGLPEVLQRFLTHAKTLN